MVRPSSKESLQLHHILQPLLVSLNPRSGVEPFKSDAERRVSHSHDRVLRNLATTHVLIQLHVQSIFTPNRSDRFVHRLSFGRYFTLQLFLQLRRWIDWNRIVREARLLVRGKSRRGSYGEIQRLRPAKHDLSPIDSQ